MHITVYYARRPMPGLSPLVEDASVILPVVDTRFMVLAPGGENPREDLVPEKHMIGIRVRRQTSAMPIILAFRERLLRYETQRVLGRRSPSTNKVNAFGARWFQPHMVMLRPGSGIDADLTRLGEPFRELIGDLLFDRFEVKILQREKVHSFPEIGEITIAKVSDLLASKWKRS
jgi:hypothetical protein